MRNLLPRMVFISAYRPNRTFAQNCMETDALIRFCQKSEMPFVRCVGTYQGTKEETMAVFCRNPWSVGMLFDWAKNIFDRDSVLLREPDGSCWILSTNAQGEYIGQWTEISKGHADSLTAHTRHGNRYFAAK